jgi:hypothetical protein
VEWCAIQLATCNARRTSSVARPCLLGPYAHPRTVAGLLHRAPSCFTGGSRSLQATVRGSCSRLDSVPVDSNPRWKCWIVVGGGISLANERPTPANNPTVTHDPPDEINIQGNYIEKINNQSARPSSQANENLVGRRKCRIRPRTSSPKVTHSSGLIHSDDSQIGRSSSSSLHESRNCRQRHAGGSSSA